MTTNYNKNMPAPLSTKRPRLRVEIALIILFKIVMLYLLWYFCFSHPVHLSKQGLVQHFLVDHKPEMS